MFLFSCSSVQQEIEQTTLHGAVEYNITALYPLDFEYNLAMLESDGSRATLVNITWEYTEKWKTEIERYYGLLYGELDEEGRALLHRSRQAWDEYCAVTEEFNSHLSARYEATGGTRIAANQLKLFRDRAVELFMKCIQLGIATSKP